MTLQDNKAAVRSKTVQFRVRDIIFGTMKPLFPLTLIAVLVMSQFPLATTAQEASTENVAAVTFLTPGFSYEVKTSQYQTLYASAFMNLAASFSVSSETGTESSFYFDPALALQYRFYYNFGKRVQRNRRTEKNSANFFALSGGTVLSKMRMSSSYFEESSRRPVYHVAGLWGIQRNMPGRLNMNLSAGLGYRWASSTGPLPDGGKVKENHGRLIVPFDMGLGIWLGRRE
ncbi:hypothetical protein EV199_0620 [Pseudobacter ginsenosidimutans]|uniref:DUF3575 domain-containing protein n=2 Tax=Pseudobacter ginsenosidimutans TaxID=661488 RepID=A0A4Q7N237_9BACT|nr:hypothetical protein EV199_0620 [Pseudobacter ginsenosidimutans]